MNDFFTDEVYYIYGKKERKSYNTGSHSLVRLEEVRRHARFLSSSSVKVNIILHPQPFLDRLTTSKLFLENGNIFCLCDRCTQPNSYKIFSSTSNK